MSATMGDLLFQQIKDWQADLPWGSVLDAGTGRHSLQWLMQQPSSQWTAVTGARSMAYELHAWAAQDMRPQDRLIVGNWVDPALLKDEQFDVVLVDYVVGAVDAFAPYFQYELFARLRPLTANRIYLIGTEPYVEPGKAGSEDARLLCEIGRLRDACLLLADERPYREYPLHWMLSSLGQQGFRVVDVKRYPIRYGQPFVDSQLRMARQRLQRLPDRQTAQALETAVSALHDRASRHVAEHGGIRHGFDYLIQAETA